MSEKDWQPVPEESDKQVLNILLSPGRTATTTIFYNANRCGSRLFKLHTCRPERIKRQIEKRDSQQTNIPKHLAIAQQLIGSIFDQSKRLNIVVPTREPVSRQISGFVRKVGIGQIDIAKLSDDEVYAKFIDFNKDSSDKWLKTELYPLAPMSDLDAIDNTKELNFLAFDRRTRIPTMQPTRCMIIKLEAPDTLMQGALSGFLCNQINFRKRAETSIKLIKQNRLAGRANRIVRQQLTEEYINEVHSGIYAKTFYSEAVLAKLKKQLLSRSNANS